jgi:hypothetical protein
MTFFFFFLYSGPLDLNFLKISPLVTSSCPSLIYNKMMYTCARICDVCVWERKTKRRQYEVV